MTDNEIIKAFKDFLNEQADGYTDHIETGGERYEFIEKELELLKETDNLINRLQAENESLKADYAFFIKQAGENGTTATEIATQYERERRSVEYIERLKEEIDRLSAKSRDNDRHIKTLKDDLNLAKEDIEFKKAEIERLKGMVSQNEGVLPQYEQLIKAEAYKECIEKVKEKSNKTELVCSGALVQTDYTITEKKLDNLLKEMESEQ